MAENKETQELTVIQTKPPADLIDSHQKEASAKPAAGPFQKYQTRWQRIGEVSCLFFSWYKDGRFPLINIGPSRGPMVFLLLFSAFCLGYMIVLINSFFHKSPKQAMISYASVFFNVYLFFSCMCRDPGIHEQIYLHYIKIRYGSKQEYSAVETTDDNNEGDLEANTQSEDPLMTSLQQRNGSVNFQSE